ncbi:MAG: SDR family oxidoreductase [Phycisphaeraceae bacterium]|nr:SDR family oxidoreductase [Phycisphaeraceae bacterium]MCW5762911.1 SDR family oxidoreductase [Phycisphaeraceae bacterium]
MAEVNRVAIVTGAGSGIGREVSLQLAGVGWRVALVGRTLGKLEAVAREIDSGERTLCIAADVGEPAAAGRIVAAATQRFGRVDALVNNAGHAPMKPFHQFSDSEIQGVFEVNVLGAIRLTREAWRNLADAKGRVVNVSSYSTIDPFAGLGVYSAAKAGLNLFARAIVNEGRGVLGFTVAPGAVETEMLRSIVPSSALPTNKTLAPADVARVIVACAIGQRDQDAGSVIAMPSP